MINIKDFNKGLLFTAAGSFWWGFIGVIYFKYISFVGHIEVVIHRCLWTTITLILTSMIFSKLNKLKNIFLDKKNFYYFYYLEFLYLLIGVYGYMQLV